MVAKRTRSGMPGSRCCPDYTVSGQAENSSTLPERASDCRELHQVFVNFQLGGRRFVAGLLVHVVGENHGLGQITHGAAQSAALVAEAKIGFFLRETVLVLQNALGSLNKLAGF